MITDDQKQAYLDALARTGVRKTACAEAGISYGTIYQHRKSDQAFAEAEALAEDEAADELVAEARRRALDGVEQEHFTKDGSAYSITKYSDVLLIFLLKGARPDVYADRSKAELSGPNGQPLQPDSVSPTATAARIVALIDEARRRREASSDDLLQ